MYTDKNYLEYRYIYNRRLNSAEKLIMNKLRNGEYCSNLIEYREILRSKLKDNEERR